MRSVYDLAYEVLDDCGIRQCAICARGGEVELHHVQHNRKANRAALGNAIQVLGVNLIPLCKACHAQSPTLDVIDSTVGTYMRNNLWRAAMIFLERAANQAIDWRLK